MKKLGGVPFKGRPHYVKILFVLLFFVTISVSITLAWFYVQDWANNGVEMAGKVNILAVGKGDEYHSIEDSAESSNLVVSLSDGYNVLIPGAEIDARANVKIFKSTTKPLLRAKVSVLLFDKDEKQVESYLDKMNIQGLLEFELREIVEEIDNWYKYSDGFYYYIGNNAIDSGNTLLCEVDATSGDVVLPFINKPFKFPTSVESAYSGFSIKFKIEFQAIQNYIPDDKGAKLPNTITNSYKIFSNLEDSKFTPTGLEYFDIKMVNGVNTISSKSGVTLPDDVVLPSYDASGNPITHISGNMKSIKNLVVPSTYTSMDAEAFNGAQLQSLDMSRANIVNIPDRAFNNCTKLSSVLLPSTLEELSVGAFRNAAITSLVLPESLKAMHSESLYLHRLTYLYIPKNLTYIYPGSIASNTGILHKIEVDPENTAYKDDQGIALLSKDGKTLEFIVQGGNITEYHIPQGVETIQSLQHMINNLSLYIPSSVKTIKPFSNFTMLKNIYVDSENTHFKSVEDNTFLISYDGKRGVVYACYNARTTLTIPDSVESIDYNALLNAKNLKTVVVGANLGVDGDTLKALRVYGNVQLQKYEVSNSNSNYYCENGMLIARTSGGITLVGVGKEATNNMVIPNGVQIIQSGAIREIIFSNKITVTFPSSITSISYNNAIHYSIVNYYEFKGTTPPSFNSNFNSLGYNLKIYVPDSAVSAYRAISALSACTILPVSQKPSN